MNEVYIVTFKSEQQDTRIGAVYFTLEEAKVEVERLESACDYVNLCAGIVIRQAVRPREWSEEQRRWMRGAP